MNIKNNKGFTLIELIIAIVAILAVSGVFTLFYLLVKALLKYIG